MDKIKNIQEEYQAWTDFKNLELRDQLIFNRLFSYLFEKKKITDNNKIIAEDLSDLNDDKKGIKITDRTIATSLARLEMNCFIMRHIYKGINPKTNRFSSSRVITLSGERFEFIKDGRKYIVSTVDDASFVEKN